MDLHEHWWQTKEFAKLTGVTVRTLHYYDRIGLLKPSRRDHNGFRLYGLPDFARLQHINTLKFIGFSLKQIKGILGTGRVELTETLALQRKIVEAQRYRLGLALEAIKRAESVLAENGRADLDAFAKINEVMNMEQNTEWTKKYYSDEAQAKIEERKAFWTPELQERVTRDWTELIADINTAMADGAQPSDERGQALAARWKGLVSGFTGGDPEIQKGLNRMYADQQNWQTEWKNPVPPEAQAWIKEAMGKCE